MYIHIYIYVYIDFLNLINFWIYLICMFFDIFCFFSIFWFFLFWISFFGIFLGFLHLFIFRHFFNFSFFPLAFLFEFFLVFFLLVFLFMFLCFENRFFTFRQVKGNTRDGRSRHHRRHSPTNQSFRVCKVDLATLKVATIKQGQKSHNASKKSRTRRVDSDWLHDRINWDPMNQIKYVNTTGASGRNSHKRIIHGRQMCTTDTPGQHHDSHHIYSKQFVSFFCGCTSCIFQHQQRCPENLSLHRQAPEPKPVRCTAMIARRTNDKNADMDSQAVLPPDCKAEGDSKRVELR